MTPADPDTTVTKLKAAIFDAFAVSHIAEAQVDFDTDGDDAALQVHPFTCIDENGQRIRERASLHIPNSSPATAGRFAFLETLMTKLLREHADKARQAIAACGFDRPRILTLPFPICSPISPISATRRGFVAVVTRAIRHWQVERIDPASVAEGPDVQIVIGTTGLPPPPIPVKRPDKRKKFRPA
jgi:hypothetical protein